jgi:hypothetical protein
MNKKRFTEGVISRLKLPEKTKNGWPQVFIWDTKTSGFGVRLTTTKKTYIIQGRVKDADADCRYTIGDCSKIPLAKARIKGQKILTQMAEGINPHEDKKAKRGYGKTLRDFAELYVNSRKDKLKAGSGEKMLQKMEKVFPDWINKEIVKITEDDIEARFETLSKGKRGNGNYSQANQAFRTLGAIMNYAQRKLLDKDRRPIMAVNPVSVLTTERKWHYIPPRKEIIPEDKLGVAWLLLQTLRSDYRGLTRTIADAACFALLTGARPGEDGEALPLEWKNVFLDRQLWYLPDPKNRRPAYLPLSDLAVKILKARFNEDNKYVFPGYKKSTYLKSIRTAMEEISEVAGVHLMPSSFRKTFTYILKNSSFVAREEILDEKSGKIKQINVQRTSTDWQIDYLLQHSLRGNITFWHYGQNFRPEQLIPNMNGVANFILLRAEKAKLEAKA